MQPSLLPPVAVLLLALFASPTTTVAAMNTSNLACAPALCGNLSISYPFWLAGTHPPECGYKGFQVTCDKQGSVSLANSYWRYQLRDIFYENSSFIVTNVDLSGGSCSVDLFFNSSSDLSLSPFSISSKNQELFFLYDCHRQERQLPRSWAPVSCGNNSPNSFALLGKGYTVTLSPDTPAVGLETPGKTVDVSLNPSPSLSTLTHLSLLFFLLPPRAGLVPPPPTHRSPPSATESSISFTSIFLSSFSTFFQTRLIHSSAGIGSPRTSSIVDRLKLRLTRAPLFGLPPHESSRVAAEEVVYEVVAEPREPLEQAQQVERHENQAQGPVDPGAEQQTQGGIATPPPTNYCAVSMIPVLGYEGATGADYQRLLQGGSLLEYTDAGACKACKDTGGQCRVDVSDDAFKCYCYNRVHSATCGRKRSDGKIIRIVLMAAAASLLFPCIYVMVCHQKGQRLRLLLGKRAISSTERNIEALIVSYGSLAPKRYNYSQVMKVTSFLSNKLGQGGYGVVYKGKLRDGRLVAVKFLHDSKGKGEEFVNEVMSIGRTSHVNIVSLFGFCLERSKRALIYEYMPNGSLDQYIFSDNPKEKLGWQKLYMIAIGIARGLEYLHHSCNTRIIHFDIKPQNILLDQGFRPKIADFGLAKLCHTKESKLSMTGARGTIGFIAPEVYSRTFGVVSTKSDVYSYGMMLLEMVGGRKNVKSMVEKSSQKYFPDWIYDHFALDDGLEACEVTCEVEEIARKMILIGLWCVQVLPMFRPTITEVLEMFEKGLDELDIPPKQNFRQIPEDSMCILSTESTGFISHTKTQAFSEVVKTKEMSIVGSKNLKRLPTL